MERIRYNTIQNLLLMAVELEYDYTLWSAWLRCVAGALYIEHKFNDSFDLVTGKSKKEIFANLNGLSDINLGDWSRSDALKWCSDTYDIHHSLRFSVETMDSIEEVRVFLLKLRNDNIGYSNLLKLKDNSNWVKNY